MNKQKVAIICSLIVILIVLIILAFFLLIDIHSKIPERMKDKYIVEVEEYSNRKVFTIHPRQNKTDKYILYFHGGAYMAEIDKYHWDFLEKVMQKTGYSIIVPDYPLTPKYTYKDVFEMVVPMYKKIIENISPENIIIMGDSAGGGLALALEQKLIEEEVQIANKLILISPWLDVTMSNPEIENIQKYDKDLNKEALKVAGIAYSGIDGMQSYLVNPINGNLGKLKNVTIYTGTYDILNPDAKVFVEKAKEEGVFVKLKEYEKATHIWILKDQSELSENAFNDLIEEIKNVNN